MAPARNALNATTARDALRQATGHLHAEVDAVMPLAQPAPTLADYHHHLCLLRAWVQALRALPVPPARLDAEQAALGRDIAECERLMPALAAPPQAPASPTPTPTPTPRGDADAIGWGVRYVIEGSRLGGQVLYRRLAPTLAPHPLDYLRGAGPGTGALWRGFMDELQAALDTPARLSAACDGAVWAFDCLLRQQRADARTTEALQEQPA